MLRIRRAEGQQGRWRMRAERGRGSAWVGGGTNTGERGGMLVPCCEHLAAASLQDCSETASPPAQTGQAGHPVSGPVAPTHHIHTLTPLWLGAHPCPKQRRGLRQQGRAAPQGRRARPCGVGGSGDAGAHQSSDRPAWRLQVARDRDVLPQDSPAGHGLVLGLLAGAHDDSPGAARCGGAGRLLEGSGGGQLHGGLGGGPGGVVVGFVLAGCWGVSGRAPRRSQRRCRCTDGGQGRRSRLQVPGTGRACEIIG